MCDNAAPNAVNRHGRRNPLPVPLYLPPLATSLTLRPAGSKKPLRVPQLREK